MRKLVCTTLISSLLFSQGVFAGATTYDQRDDPPSSKLLWKVLGGAVVGGYMLEKHQLEKQKEADGELDNERDRDYNECPTDMPYGPYYRYEKEEKYAIQTITTQRLYGAPPQYSDKYVVQAYAKPQVRIKGHDTSRFPPKFKVKFCTAIQGEYSKPYQHWYYGQTPGVEMKEDGTAAMIKVITLPCDVCYPNKYQY